MSNPRQCPQCKKTTFAYNRPLARWQCTDPWCAWRDR